MSLPSYNDLLRQLDEARKESAYYRKIAQVAGRARLQETEKLSMLVRARREAEQRLELARDELDKRVKERTAELSRANSELRAEIAERKQAEEAKRRLELQLRHSEKLEAIGTLAGLVAHDLNNILSGVVSYPELLLMDLPEHSQLKEPLSTIHHSGLKATAVVQDLLTLARRGVSAKAPLELNQIISEYLESPEFFKLQDFHPDVEILLELQQQDTCSHDTFHR